MGFTDDNRLTVTSDGIQVECSVYDPCGIAVIELQCLDSNDFLVDEIFLPSSSFCSHTISDILLSQCEIYTVNYTVSYPVINEVISQQSVILYSAEGEHYIAYI